MAAPKTSLRNIATRERLKALAAANSGPVTGRIIEIDPNDIHDAGLRDRFIAELPAIHQLAASIKAIGQKVPILVRPDPDQPGTYQIVAGRRRLAACREIGRAVRAEIQDMSIHDLVLGQASENIARENLSYIEKARLAALMVDAVGVAPAEIDDAFACDKTERSRFLKIGRGVPPDVLEWIGKAPGIGRPRWEQLVGLLEDDDRGRALGEVRATLSTANHPSKAMATSDGRFLLVLKAALGASTHNGPMTTAAKDTDIWVDGDEQPCGQIRPVSRGLQLTLYPGDDPEFLVWIAENCNAVAQQLRAAYSDAQTKGDTSSSDHSVVAGRNAFSAPAKSSGTPGALGSPNGDPDRKRS